MSDCHDDANQNSKLQSQDSFEPGAARFGNFINYYSFNSVSKRLAAIPSDLLCQRCQNQQRVLWLDIGCNSGELTIGLYPHLTSTGEKPHLHIFGIDLDDTLIERSNSLNVLFPNCIKFQKLDIMDKSSMTEITAFLQKHNKTKFDFISCFSTTMWIHLNHGDDGLERFLKDISKITRYLLLEPQEWKCYRAAVRRMTRLNREVFAIKKLKIKDVVTHIKQFLATECAMELEICFGETSWGRKLYLFKNNSLL